MLAGGVEQNTHQHRRTSRNSIFEVVGAKEGQAASVVAGWGDG